MEREAMGGKREEKKNLSCKEGREKGKKKREKRT